jgi:fatty acid desaturase
MSAYLRERLALAKAMKSCPSHIGPGECDYTPPMEMVGIYIVHATITRMVAREELDINAGTFVNAALGCHAFCVLHHCTHESISQSNPEHEKLENMAFRLGNLLIFFDDGYKEAHREHHQRTNASTDPDLILSHSPLPVFGSLLHHLTTQKSFLSIGSPIDPSTARVLHFFGLIKHLTAEKSWLTKQLNVVNWDNMVLKIASYEALRVFEENKEYEKLSHTLRATWRTSNSLSTMLLALFFARYPHRNGIDGPPNEVDSFYDMTYKGRGQVDLWMMGEGAHHMHHAKSNVSYSRLPKMSKEVEDAHPELKLKARQNMDLHTLEYTHKMPPLQEKDAPSSDQRFWRRTEQVEEGRALLATDPSAGVQKIADAVFSSALHVCTTSDKALLRKVTKDMGHREHKEDPAAPSPVPTATWHKTVLSEATSSLLTEQAERIRVEVLAVAEQVGKKLPPLVDGAAIKEHFLDFFIALADTLTTPAQQMLFFETACASTGGGRTESFAKDLGEAKIQLVERLRAYLTAPVPADFSAEARARRRLVSGRGNGKYSQAHQRARELFFGKEGISAQAKPRL